MVSLRRFKTSCIRLPDLALSFLGPQAKRLLEEHAIDASESREKNLNRFMQFIGVSYQMVGPPIIHSVLIINENVFSYQVPSQASSVGGSTIAGI